MSRNYEEGRLVFDGRGQGRDEIAEPRHKAFKEEVNGKKNME